VERVVKLREMPFSSFMEQFGNIEIESEVMLGGPSRQAIIDQLGGMYLFLVVSLQPWETILLEFKDASVVEADLVRVVDFVRGFLIRDELQLPG
jgi:hypothetical protein